MTKTISALVALAIFAATAGQALALNPQPLPPRCITAACAGGGHIHGIR